MAGAIRMGGGYFEMFGRDRLSPMLDKLKGKAKETDSFLKRLGKGGLGALGGGLLGGALGKIAGGALAGGGPGAALGAVMAGKDFLMQGVGDAASTARDADRFGISIELMSKFRRVAEDFGVTVDEVMGDTTGRFHAAIVAAHGIDADRARQALEFERKMAAVTRDLQEALLPLLEVLVPVVQSLAEFTKGIRELGGAIGKKGVKGAAEDAAFDFIAARNVGGVVDAVMGNLAARLKPGGGGAIPPQLQALLSAAAGPTGIKGAFQTFGAMGQFGFGDSNSEPKKQTEILRQLLDGKGALPDKIGDALKNAIIPK